eukprot:2651726-Amphidinium_carterae.1
MCIRDRCSNIAEQFLAQAESNSDRGAVMYHSELIKYRDLALDVCALAAWLRESVAWPLGKDTLLQEGPHPIPSNKQET